MQTTYSRYFEKLSQTLGFYEFGGNVIAIEAPERASGIDFTSVFEHESTHKFLVELSEMGFVLSLVGSHRISKSPTLNRIISCINVIMDDFRFYQECFATNMQIIYLKQNNFSEEKTINGFDEYYLNAFNQLSSLRPLFFNDIERAKYYLLNIGLQTFCFPVFVLLFNCASNEVSTHLFKDLIFILRDRFNRSIESFLKIYNINFTTKEIMSLHNECFGLPTPLVNRDSILELATTLNAKKEMPSIDFEQISKAYADKHFIDIEDLLEIVKFNAFKSTTTHHHLRLTENVIFNKLEPQSLIEACAKHNVSYVFYGANYHDFDVTHGLKVKSKKVIIYADFFSHFVKFNSSNGTYQMLLETPINSVHCICDLNELDGLLKCVYIKSILVTFVHDFDFSNNNLHGISYKGLKNPRLVLIEPYLSFSQLNSILEKLKGTNHHYLLHVVYLEEDGSSFLSIKQKDDNSWIFLAPFWPTTLIQDLITAYCNQPFIEHAKSKKEFGMDFQVEMLIYGHLLHYSTWGW